MKWLIGLLVLGFCSSCSFLGPGTPDRGSQSELLPLTNTPYKLFLPQAAKDSQPTVDVLAHSATPDPSLIETMVAEGIAATMNAMPTITANPTSTPIIIPLPTPTIEQLGIGTGNN